MEPVHWVHGYGYGSLNESSPGIFRGVVRPVVCNHRPQLALQQSLDVPQQHRAVCRALCRVP
jgi:hypothetical protein